MGLTYGVFLWARIKGKGIWQLKKEENMPGVLFQYRWNLMFNLIFIAV
jgi:hypothetical protein